MPSVQRRVTPRGKIPFRAMVRVKGHKTKTATFIKRTDALLWAQETESYLAMNRASLLEIADILWHKTLQLVKRYSHLSDDHKASVLEKMNEKIFG